VARAIYISSNRWPKSPRRVAARYVAADGVSSWSRGYPEEQVYGLLDLYISGERLNFGEMYKPLYPHERGIWELRTIDVRIFGWFQRRDCFIGVFAGDATHIHQYHLHAGYRNEVVRLRDLLNLDEPKFVEGIDEDDVLSIRS
jgi:hypothetical protein